MIEEEIGYDGPTNRLLGKLPKRLQWVCHNVLAHPLSEVLFQFGLTRWSKRVHDATVPQ